MLDLHGAGYVCPKDFDPAACTCLTAAATGIIAAAPTLHFELFTVFATSLGIGDRCDSPIGCEATIRAKTTLYVTDMRLTSRLSSISPSTRLGGARSWS